MKWNCIHERYYNSAYSFLDTDKKFVEVVEKELDIKASDYDDFCDFVDEVIEDYGGDGILIENVLENIYDPNLFFTLVDYNEKYDNLYVRIWELEKDD